MNRNIFNFLIYSLSSVFFSFKLLANPYSALGIPPNSSDEEVLNAYREKAKQTHPDRSNLPSEIATQQFKRIQSAYEEIQKLRRSPEIVKPSATAETFRREAEKASAKTAARSTLEKAWTTNTFGDLNLSDLPVISKLLNSKVQFTHGRGPKEEGEWEAIREFLADHQIEYLKSNPPFERVSSLLRDIDLYMDYSGQAVKDVRSGVTAPFEEWLFDHTSNQDQFLESLTGRFRRLGRAGAFPLSHSTPEERARLFGSSLTKYQELFSEKENSGHSLASQAAREIIQTSLKQIKSNPLRCNELEFLIRSVPAALNEEEKLQYLGDLKIQIDSLAKGKSYGTVSDFSTQIARSIQRVFDKNPELKSKYSQKFALWNRISGKVSSCELLLGRLANSR